IGSGTKFARANNLLERSYGSLLGKAAKASIDSSANFPWQRCQSPLISAPHNKSFPGGIMRNVAFTKVALMCAASVVALTAAAQAQSENNVEAVTVTGSRVISNIQLSPTPLTVVTAEQLAATTPTDIPDALNKLPDFIGGSTPRSQNNGSTNNSGNTLNLRNLGAQRTLVLLDGQRLAPSNQR